MSIKSKITEIFAMAYEVNTTTNMDVQLSYHGSSDCLSCSVFLDGYEIGTKDVAYPLITGVLSEGIIYLGITPEEDSKKVLDSTIQDLKSLLKGGYNGSI